MNVTTVEDMSVLLDGLKLDKYPIMMYTGAGAKNLLALTVAALKGAGHDVKTLRGVIGGDPIGELVKPVKPKPLWMLCMMKWLKPLNLLKLILRSCALFSSTVMLTPMAVLKQYKRLLTPLLLQLNMYVKCKTRC